MQYVVKPEIEPKISLIILLEKMSDEDYTGFFSELNHLLEKDHSLVFDCSALNEVNPPGIQALSALSAKAKKFNNIVAFFGVSNRVNQAFVDAKVIDEIVISANNFEAMKLAKQLQPQKEELRNVGFGREQNLPKSEQAREQVSDSTNNVPSPPAIENQSAEEQPKPPEDKPGLEEKAEDPSVLEESTFYKHIKAQAEQAVTWDRILDEKLGEEVDSEEDHLTFSEDTTEIPPGPEEPKTSEQPFAAVQGLPNPLPATAGEGVTQYEKEMLFDEVPVSPTSNTPEVDHSTTLDALEERLNIPAPPPLASNETAERGVSLAEREDLFTTVSNTSGYSISSGGISTGIRKPLLLPVLLSLVLVVGVFNLFKEPIQVLLFSTETMDAIALYEVSESANSNASGHSDSGTMTNSDSELPNENNIKLPEDMVSNSLDDTTGGILLSDTSSLLTPPPIAEGSGLPSDDKLLAMVSLTELPTRLAGISLSPRTPPSPLDNTEEPANQETTNPAQTDSMSAELERVFDFKSRNAAEFAPPIDTSKQNAGLQLTNHNETQNQSIYIQSTQPDFSPTIPSDEVKTPAVDTVAPSLDPQEPQPMGANQAASIEDANPRGTLTPPQTPTTENRPTRGNSSRASRGTPSNEPSLEADPGLFE